MPSSAKPVFIRHTMELRQDLKTPQKWTPSIDNLFCFNIPDLHIHLMLSSTSDRNSGVLSTRRSMFQCAQAPSDVSSRSSKRIQSNLIRYTQLSDCASPPAAAKAAVRQGKLQRPKGTARVLPVGSVPAVRRRNRWWWRIFTS